MDMTDATLQAFRDIAEQMIGKADWQWIGPHMSQRMFGITQERAESYAKAHGGIAQCMDAAYYGNLARVAAQFAISKDSDTEQNAAYYYARYAFRAVEGCR